MRILFLTPIYPFPVNSGVSQRMYLTIKVLAGIGEVTLFSLRDSGFQEHGLHGGLCHEIHTVALEEDTTVQRNIAMRIHRACRNILDSRPVYTRCLDFPNWHARFQALRPETYDLVWVQTLGLYEMVRRYQLRNVAIDLDGADSFKVRRELGKKTILNPRVALEWLDYAKLLHAETALRPASHCFVACSGRDRKHLERFGKRVWLVRNSVAIPPLHSHEIENPGTFLYIGTLGYQPNREAVSHFVKCILPIINQSYPRAVFHIVGSRPSQDVLELARHPNVTISADVPSVEPYLRRASVVVVPLLNGSGTRIKIIEAMSFAKPVISTSIGAEGLNLEHQNQILIADGPRQFADCCMQLLHCDATRTRLGDNGRLFVQKNHSAQAAENDIYQFLEEAFSMSAPRIGSAESVHV